MSSPSSIVSKPGSPPSGHPIVGWVLKRETVIVTA
jgi:hypothetical protein